MRLCPEPLNPHNKRGLGPIGPSGVWGAAPIHPEKALQFLTDFGDSAITLPLLCLIALAGRWRVGAAVAGAFGAILVLKLLFGVFPAYGIRSPSGHTACAAATYGGLALLIAGRTAGLCAATLTAAAIGASRVVLDMHSAPEVLLGGAVGIAAVWLARPLTVTASRALTLAVLAILIISLLHGRRASIEPTLVQIEHSLRSWVGSDLQSTRRA